ncbi:hypothetical protein B0A55_02556 [Friedmanniomyces simplex]|uniref:Eukaryotic translation initiation factor 2A n=1 Tax=Friedmanniomyces simplex TaxID=329884 RepID=A0A4U0XTE5_9PEZI|nr:hypothetical protein B0A55_02556 [Friedmanniomyces simplex]
MSRRTLRAAQFYAAFYRWTLLTSPLRYPHAVRHSALFSATAQCQEDEYQAPIRKLHRGSSPVSIHQTPRTNLDKTVAGRNARARRNTNSNTGKKERWRTRAAQNATERPFKTLKGWQEVVRYRSDRGIMLEIAIPWERAREVRKAYGEDLNGLNAQTGARSEMGSPMQSAHGEEVTSLLVSGTFDEAGNVMRTLERFKREEKGAEVVMGEHRPLVNDARVLVRPGVSDPMPPVHNNSIKKGRVRPPADFPLSAMKPWQFAVRAQGVGTLTMDYVMPEACVQALQALYGSHLKGFITERETLNGAQVDVSPTLISFEDSTVVECRCLTLTGRSDAVAELRSQLYNFRPKGPLYHLVLPKSTQTLGPWTVATRARTIDTVTLELSVPASRVPGFRAIWGPQFDELTKGKLAGVHISVTPPRTYAPHGQLCSVIITGPPELALRARDTFMTYKPEPLFQKKLGDIDLANATVRSHLVYPSEHIYPGGFAIRSKASGGEEGSVEFVLKESVWQAVAAKGGVSRLREQVREALGEIEVGEVRKVHEQRVRSVLVAGKLSAMPVVRDLIGSWAASRFEKEGAAASGEGALPAPREGTSTAIFGVGDGRVTTHVAASDDSSTAADKPTTVAGSEMHIDDYFAAAAAEIEDEPASSTAAEPPASHPNIRKTKVASKLASILTLIPQSPSRVHIAFPSWAYKYFEGSTRSRLLRQSGAANLEIIRTDEQVYAIVDGSEKAHQLAGTLMTQVIDHARHTDPYVRDATLSLQGLDVSAPRKYFARVGMPGATIARRREFLGFVLGANADKLFRLAILAKAFVVKKRVDEDGWKEVWGFSRIAVERLVSMMRSVGNQRPDLREEERDGVVVLERWVEGARKGQQYMKIADGWADGEEEGVGNVKEEGMGASTAVSFGSGRVGAGGVEADVHVDGGAGEKRAGPAVDTTLSGVGVVGTQAIAGKVSLAKDTKEASAAGSGGGETAGASGGIVSEPLPSHTDADPVRTAAALADDVRAVSRLLTHPVVLITSRSPSRDPVTSESDWLAHCRGVTVSSFTTLTLDPVPVVTFNLKVPSGTWDAIAASERLCVHILASTPEAAALAHLFSVPHARPEDPFRALGELGAGSRHPIPISRRELRSRPIPPTPPRISNFSGSILARLHATLLKQKCVRVADHVVVVAEVRKLVVTKTTAEGQKEVAEALEGLVGLAYGRRRYRGMGEEIEVGSLNGMTASKEDTVDGIDEVNEDKERGNEVMSPPEAPDVNEDKALSSIDQALEGMVDEAGSEPAGQDAPSQSKTARRNAAMEEEDEYDFGFGGEDGQLLGEESMGAFDQAPPTVGNSLATPETHVTDPSILSATVAEFLGETGEVKSRGRMQALLNAKKSAARAARELESALADGSLTPERSLQLERTIAGNERRVARKLAFRAADELRRMLDTGKVDVRRSQWLETAVEKGMAICVEDAKRARAGFDEGRLDEERFGVVRERLGVDFGVLNQEAMRLRLMVDEEQEGGGMGGEGAVQEGGQPMSENEYGKDSRTMDRDDRDLAYRTSKQIGILDAAPIYERLPGFHVPEGNLRCCVYSPDGRFFSWASPDKVTVVDASVGHVVTELPADNVYELGFSHSGTYIITWQRPSKDADGNATKNLKVWRTIDDKAGEGGERDVVGKFVQKNQTGWNLQYTSDEEFCARCVNNEVQIYESKDLGTVWNKLRVEGVTDFALSPGKTHSVAVFTPERKGQPASVKVFNVPQFAAPVSQKTFFKGDKVQLKWNQEGTSVIVLAQTEVDKSNKSYYGETNMYILSANGGFDSRIQLDKEGPIHDVSWSPNSKEFGVTYGYMPAKTTIFNQRAVAQHSFNLGPRNTIIFSPHGRFVIVAGFGNLAGQMDIYDLEKNYEKVCTIEASNTSSCEWSPDGRHILTATTSPRLRVDNGIRIWHVAGGLMYNEEFVELYHVVWRPQSTLQHPLENPLHPAPTPHPSALDFLGKVKTPSKPAGAYRPPGARGTATPLAFKREDEGGAAFVREMMSGKEPRTNGFGPSAGRRAVPGAETVEPKMPPGALLGGGVSLVADGDENLSKAALKNKKKREAKKAKDAEAKSTGGLAAPPTENGGASTPERTDRPRSRSKSGYESPSPQTQRQDGSRRREGSRPLGPPPGLNITTPGPKQQQQQPQAQPNGNGTAAKSAAKAAPPPPEPVAPELTVTSPGAGSPEEKKIRSLLKKLRAIDDLKMRQAGGEKLEGTQVLKIGTEEVVRRELGEVGFVE